MPEIVIDPSPNFDDRGPGVAVDMLVLHYTGMETKAAALDRLKDAEAEVSAHYLIDEDGNVHRLVDEGQRAWHAGVSHWRGHTNINARSIGIELVNPGHEFGYHEFPEAQIRELEAVCHGVLARHAIPARNVVGHSDVAPARKQDPGERFGWRRLAGAGIGLWPDAGASERVREDAVAAALEAIGYDVADLDAAVSAFQRRFRPSLIDGAPDAETRQLLAAYRALI